ncbi:MAG TPA: HAD family hydrolase [Candidatus Synoicihabitans sp.]|nr:HAD family hydrolase [Candidatus Synoicihabitans sp.]
MISTIGFDADDTLWHNESIFARTHERLRNLLSSYHDAPTVDRALFATEMRNLERYGYGIKSFALSAIETAVELSRSQLRADEVMSIIRLTQAMLDHPVEVLPHVVDAITAVGATHRLIVITKGDLRDQERKVEKSGLAGRFAAIEIVSEKNAATYRKVLERHHVRPEKFLMVGNSIKSDVLPVLELGAHAAFVPYPITWEHERVTAVPDGPRYHPLASIAELPDLVGRLQALPP